MNAFLLSHSIFFRRAPRLSGMLILCVLLPISGRCESIKLLCTSHYLDGRPTEDILAIDGQKGTVNGKKADFFLANEDYIEYEIDTHSDASARRPRIKISRKTGVMELSYSLNPERKLAPEQYKKAPKNEF